MNQLIMHANFGEVRFAQFGYNTVDSICKLATETGYEGIEFRSSVPADRKDMEFTDFLDEIMKAKEKYGVKTLIFGVGVGASASSDKEEREKSVLRACELIKEINDKCGVTLFNSFGQWIRSPHKTAPQNIFEYHGSGAATEDNWKYTVESYKKVAEVIEKLDVKIALETHMNYIHDLPAPTVKLVNLIDSKNVGINMDFGNTIEFVKYPSLEDTIDMYGDKIFYVHVKNGIKPQGVERLIATDLAEGIIDHRGYFKKLKEVGYNGPIGVECIRPGHRLLYAKKDFKYAKEVLTDIE